MYVKWKEVLLVTEEDVIRLERNNVRMIRGYALLGLRIGLLKMNLELNQN